MKIKYVRQKHRSGCAVACIAMITGLSYDAVKKQFQTNFEHGGMKPEHSRDFILEHGFSAIEVTPSTYKNVPTINKRLSKPFADIHFVSVQPFADSEVNHAIVMDKNGRVYDPEDPKCKDLSRYYCIVSVIGFWRH